MHFERSPTPPLPYSSHSLHPPAIGSTAYSSSVLEQYLASLPSHPHQQQLLLQQQQGSSYSMTPSISPPRPHRGQNQSRQHSSTQTTSVRDELESFKFRLGMMLDHVKTLCHVVKRQLRGLHEMCSRNKSLCEVDFDCMSKLIAEKVAGAEERLIKQSAQLLKLSKENGHLKASLAKLQKEKDEEVTRWRVEAERRSFQIEEELASLCKDLLKQGEGGSGKSAKGPFTDPVDSTRRTRGVQVGAMTSTCGAQSDPPPLRYNAEVNCDMPLLVPRSLISIEEWARWQCTLGEQHARSSLNEYHSLLLKFCGSTVRFEELSQAYFDFERIKADTPSVREPSVTAGTQTTNIDIDAMRMVRRANEGLEVAHARNLELCNIIATMQHNNNNTTTTITTSSSIARSEKDHLEPSRPPISPRRVLPEDKEVVSKSPHRSRGGGTFGNSSPVVNVTNTTTTYSSNNWRVTPSPPARRSVGVAASSPQPQQQPQPVPIPIRLSTPALPPAPQVMSEEELIQRIMIAQREGTVVDTHQQQQQHRGTGTSPSYIGGRVAASKMSPPLQQENDFTPTPVSVGPNNNSVNGYSHHQYHHHQASPQFPTSQQFPASRMASAWPPPGNQTIPPPPRPISSGSIEDLWNVQNRLEDLIKQLDYYP
eukprot:PhF_6_TR14937/c0_g1_i7/m.23395